MARTVLEDEQLSSYSLRSWGRVIAFGSGVGLLYWLLALVISNFVIDPIACRRAIEAACVDAVPIAGRVSTVIIAAFAVAGMVRFGVVRPVLIAVAAAVILWDLATYTQGLGWIEAVLWSMLAYAVSYALFGWLARSASTLLAIIFTVLVVIVILLTLIA